MVKRLKTSLGVVAGLAALALGGSAIADAASTTPTKAAGSPTHESATAAGTDNVQSGSQTAPDETAATESTSASDGDNVQQGSQTAPDTANAGKADEASGESSGEGTANNDGLGGYADAPGNANTQQQGQN